MGKLGGKLGGTDGTLTDEMTKLKNGANSVWARLLSIYAAWACAHFSHASLTS